jgi:hypothetical protein
MKIGISTLLFSCSVADAGQAHIFGLQKRCARIADAEQGSSGREIFFGANSCSSVNFKPSLSFAMVPGRTKAMSSSGIFKVLIAN